MFVDTNFIVELLREQNANRNGPAQSKLASIRHVKLQMPVFVLCELRAGAVQTSAPQADVVESF
jgi:predicted nucleic acid-binding protein